MANLLVEVGNTALKAAWSEGTTLGKTFRYQGERTMKYLLSLMEKEKPEVLTVASSAGVTAEEEKMLSKECGHLIILDRNHTDILLGYDIPEYITYDRAAGIIAASSLFKGKPCTIFDFGTTLTIDYTDAGGKHEAGFISPGCRMRFRALNRYSRNIPLVNVSDERKPDSDSLESSVEAGVISGIMFEICGHIEKKPENIIIFTGGDAIYFAKKMKNSIFVVSNLCLMGLALMTEEYVKKNIR